MKVDIKDAPNSQKEIAVELPYEKFQQAMDAECDRVAKDAKVAGFRPGKAPKDVVMKQHLHQIRSAAMEATVSNAMREILIENNINPIARPDVKDVVIEDDKPVSFTLMVDVFPEFTVDKYKGFEFDKVSIKVTKKDVDDTIEKLLEQYAELKPIARKRKVKEGDHTIIDFEGKIDGVPFDGGKAEKHTLEIGSGQFIPGFEDSVIGMSIDEVKDITVTFPTEYHMESLAGKDAVFTVKLHEIQEKVAPERNDEFAHKVAENFNTIAELEAAIEKDLQAEADNFVKMTTFSAIADKLVEENFFEVPVSIVMEQATAMAQRNFQQYYEMGINPEMMGMNLESFAEMMKPEAEKQVKRAILINKIAEDHKIELSDEEIDAEIARVAELTGRAADELKKEVLGNDQYASALKNDLMSTKIYNFLQEANKIKETVMTREEFEKDRADKAAKAKEEAGEGEAKKTTKKAAAKKTADADSETKAEKKPAAKKPAAKKTAKKED